MRIGAEKPVLLPVAAWQRTRVNGPAEQLVAVKMRTMPAVAPFRSSTSESVPTVAGGMVTLYHTSRGVVAAPQVGAPMPGWALVVAPTVVPVLTAAPEVRVWAAHGSSLAGASCRVWKQMGPTRPLLPLRPLQFRRM